MPRFANATEFVRERRWRFFDSACWIRSQMDRALTWDTIGRVRALAEKALVIKELLRVEDVVRAAEFGADAVALSNHGGRQLDWCVAPLDILPAARSLFCARSSTRYELSWRRLGRRARSQAAPAGSGGWR